jgi:hypothetical protein
MKCLILLFTAIGIASGAGAQNSGPLNIHLKEKTECGFDKVVRKLNVPYSTLIDAYRPANNPSNTAAKGAGVVYDIPVVFHVIYGASQAPFNLPDSVLINQLAVLNQAYRKQHGDTANTRAIFKPLSGDAEIQFHLATLDPQGNPTTGITRTVSSRRYFGDENGDIDSLERIKKTAEGGKDPWPTKRYLNIWIANLSDSVGEIGVLGYAIPPLNPIPANWPAGADQDLLTLTDGVVLQTHAVGSNNSLSPALQGLYTKGRCAVHEVGHYLGLMHIFGSNGGGTGSCGAMADDGINDTPEQSQISFTNSGCPSATKNTCGAVTPGDLPDMWENYMDYCRDACQTMFTFNQIDLIRGVMANQRNSLVQGSSSVPVIGSQKTFGLYPNPAGNTLSVLYEGKINRATVVNVMGQQLLVAEGAAANTKSFDISHLPAGNYILLLDTEEQRLVNKFSVLR